jgi:hypothetical protein
MLMLAKLFYRPTQRFPIRLIGELRRMLNARTGKLDLPRDSLAAHDLSLITTFMNDL